MSNDISYILQVVDDFSVNLSKFKSSLGSVDNSVKNIDSDIKKASTSSKFFSQSLMDLGKAAGIYIGFQGIKNFAMSVFDTRVQMDSLTASLTAIMPKFDKTKTGAQLAAEEIEYLKTVTEKFGLNFKEALPNYMQFLASSTQNLATTRKTFEAFAGVSRMYGLSAQRFGLVINALNQMQSKGTISMEELRQQLGDSLPGALKLFADAAGVTTAQFTKLVGNGQIGAGLIKKVAEEIEKKFGKDMVQASATLGAETERLSNSWLFFKDQLSKGVAPALNYTVSSLKGAIDLMRAVGDQNTFLKLGEDGQAFVTILRVTLGLLQGIVKEISLITKIGKFVWEGGKDAVKAATITGYALTGGDKEVARGAYQDLWQQSMNRFSAEDQKVQVDINLNNAPRGTTTEVATPNNSGKVKVGNIVNYATEGGY